MSQAHTTKSLVIFHAEGETDAAAVAEFGKHLAPLTSGGQLSVWDFRDIAPGVNRLARDAFGEKFLWVDGWGF